MSRLFSRQVVLISLLALSGVVVSISDRAQAQLVSQSGSQLGACAPPSSSEYLLLAVTPTVDAQSKVIALLPISSKAIACNYLGETVLRVGGFATEDAATAWSSYISQQTSVSAFVARPSIAGQPAVLAPLPPSAATPPPAGTAPTLPPAGTAPTPAPTTPIGGFNPQPLGGGYAVLVNHYNRPELANQVRRSTGQPVGLVAYGQKSYLLASFTTDQSTANTLLQSLTDKGLWAMVVDGRRVMLVQTVVGP
jgi:hypothetical protein